MKSGIYAIWNSQADKIYIGQAVDIYRRWRYHKLELKNDTHRNPYLQSAYNKNGKLYMVFYVLEYCSNSQYLLDEREQFYMDIYNSYDREFGYNLSPTAGGSCTGYKHSEETKAEWSKNRKGKKRSEEGLAALRLGAAKRKLTYVVSEETRKKLSDSHKGKTQTEEFKAAMSERLKGNQFNTGKVQSQKHKDAISKANTGKTRTDEQKQKMSAWQIGKTYSEETKLKMSLAAKARHAKAARLRFKALMFID